MQGDGRRALPSLPARAMQQHELAESASSWQDTRVQRMRAGVRAKLGAGAGIDRRACATGLRSARARPATMALIPPGRLSSQVVKASDTQPSGTSLRRALLITAANSVRRVLS